MAGPAWRKASDALAQVTTYMAEGLSGRGRARVREEERHLAEFERHNEETQRRVLHSNSLWRTIRPLVKLIIAVTVAAVLVYGAREAVGGAVEVGLIVSFTAYLRQALAPLPQLTALAGDFQQAATALEKLDEILAEPPNPASSQAAVRPRPSRRAGLRGRPVRLRRRALDHPRRQRQHRGRSGRGGHRPLRLGQETLIKLALGFYGPQRGCIR